MTPLPNTGILSDDHLDKLRGAAVLASHARGLPDAVIEYLCALEDRYLGLQAEGKLRGLKDVKWGVKVDKV